MVSLVVVLRSSTLGPGIENIELFMVPQAFTDCTHPDGSSGTCETEPTWTCTLPGDSTWYLSFFLMGAVSTNQIRLLVHSGVLSVLL